MMLPRNKTKIVCTIGPRSMKSIWSMQSYVAYRLKINLRLLSLCDSIYSRGHYRTFMNTFLNYSAKYD